MGGFLINKIKIRGKEALRGNSLKLFFVSLISFLLRYLSLVIAGVVIYYFISEGFSFLYMLIPSSVLVFSFLFICAIRAGEQYTYLATASGKKTKLSYLLSFCHIRRSVEVAILYIKVNMLKTLWFMYFSIPVAFCMMCGYYLYSRGDVGFNGMLVIYVGTTAMAFLCCVVWRCSSLRYANSLLCLVNEKNGVDEAIKKSTLCTDGFLGDGVVLECSFAMWLLSCVSVIPVIYVVPYIKICKAMLALQADEKILLAEYVQ